MATLYKALDLFLDMLISMFCFRWSYDGKYFARLSPDTLSVYETDVS